MEVLTKKSDEDESWLISIIIPLLRITQPKLFWSVTVCETVFFFCLSKYVTYTVCVLGPCMSCSY